MLLQQRNKLRPPVLGAQERIAGNARGHDSIFIVKVPGVLVVSDYFNPHAILPMSPEHEHVEDDE